jgi:hypothetical protein
MDNLRVKNQPIGCFINKKRRLKKHFMKLLYKNPFKHKGWPNYFIFYNNFLV